MHAPQRVAEACSCKQCFSALSSVCISVHSCIQVLHLLWRGTHVPLDADDEVHGGRLRVAPRLQPAPAGLSRRVQDLRTAHSASCG